MQIPSYEVIKQEKDKVSLTFEIKGNEDFFKGHFDLNPIMPAVAQLSLVQHFGKIFFIQNLQFQELQKAKFKALITPGCTIKLSLEFCFCNFILSFQYEDNISNELKSLGKIKFE